jgi:hypothetical protein
MIPIEYNGIVYGIFSEWEIKALVAMAFVSGCAVTYLASMFFSWVETKMKNRQKFIDDLDDKTARKYNDFLRS